MQIKSKNKGDKKFTNIQKDLLKEMKLMKPGNRVVVMATTSRPQETDSKILKFFNCQIEIPSPSYGMRHAAWRYFVDNKYHKLPGIDYSMLAMVSAGFSLGSIKNAIDRILTQRRVTKVLKILGSF